MMSAMPLLWRIGAGEDRRMTRQSCIEEIKFPEGIVGSALHEVAQPPDRAVWLSRKKADSKRGEVIRPKLINDQDESSFGRVRKEAG